MIYLHTQGDTFQQVWRVVDSSGQPMDLTGWTGRAHLRDSKGQLTQEFTVTTSGVDLTVYASYPETEVWPVGLYEANLEITNGLDRRSSTRFQIDVTRDPTR